MLQGFTQRQVAVPGDVLLDGQRIDINGVAQHDLLLFLEQIDIMDTSCGFLGSRRPVEQSGYGPAVENMFFDDGIRILGTQAAIESGVGIDDGYRPHVAGSHATGQDDPDRIRNAVPGEGLLHGIDDFTAFRRNTPLPAAHHDMGLFRGRWFPFPDLENFLHARANLFEFLQRLHSLTPPLPNSGFQHENESILGIWCQGTLRC